MNTRDGAAMGRAAGSLLADVLLALSDGENVSGPRGTSRAGRAQAKVSFTTHAEAGAWLQTPGLVDAVLVDVQPETDGVCVVRVLIPGAAPPSFDVVWMVRAAVDEQGIATSEPAFIVADGVDDAFVDELQDGVAAGLEQHPRTGELRDGFGALGPYDSRDAS